MKIQQHLGRLGMTTVKDVLERARSQIGVKGTGPGGNRSPYGDWYGLTGEWCGMFVSWCFYQEGLPLGPHPKGFSFTPEGATWFQNRSKWTKTAPQPGYVVFFNWPGGHPRIEHVGIVASVNADGSIETIEGNTLNSQVAPRHRTGSIVGYGIPDYAGAETHDWFERATSAELEHIVRRALNEGTAYGQPNWAGTSKACLGTAQNIVNTLNQRVLARL
jgi:cell wall-associated NlpC family hydrolase